MSKYDNAKKQTILTRYTAGAPVSAISADTGIPRSTIYMWVKVILYVFQY